jgi:hypothetical protein
MQLPQNSAKVNVPGRNRTCETFPPGTNRRQRTAAAKRKGGNPKVAALHPDRKERET